MAGKHHTHDLLSLGVACIGMLLGECLVVSTALASPSFKAASENVLLVSSADNAPPGQHKPGNIPLRFRKDDFVPIPDLAPIPLDAPPQSPSTYSPVPGTVIDRDAHDRSAPEVQNRAVPSPETLSPAAGQGAPLISLSDLPPELAATTPAQSTKIPIAPAPSIAPIPAPVQAGVPLIMLPSASSSPPATAPAMSAVPQNTPLPALSVRDHTEAPAPAEDVPTKPAIKAKTRVAKHGALPVTAAPAPQLAGSSALPANIPADALQHWFGPDAIEASAINTLPSAIVAPTGAASNVTETSVTVSIQPGQVEATDKTEPKPVLSEESKKILDKLRPQPERKKLGTPEPIFVEHARNLKSLDQPEQLADAAVAHQASGLKIEMKPQRINYNHELEKAYDALIAGQSGVAIATYKKVLDNDPNNKNALFGLATVYHRAGQIDLARPLYAKLLSIDPGNSDGLNNFLVLLSDEAPEEALAELQKLAERNPQYSALPAQISLVYQKLGQYDKAGDYMLRAVQMAPENVTYRYNFAIMLDKQHKYEQAAPLYRQVIQAYQRGETIPGNIQKIQQRLTYISSNRPN